MTTPASVDESSYGRNWTITGQTETQQLVNGQFLDGVSVGFTTQFGQSGSVFIPRLRYTPANVAREVTAQALIMDQVHNLTSD
jgi:hypothetical protein